MSYSGLGEPPEDPQGSPRPPTQPSPSAGEPYDQASYHAQPGYADQPGHYSQQGQPGNYGPPGQPGGINVLAILSLVFAFVFAPAGIVLGHLARRQIHRTGEPGGQLVTWGLVLSYLFTALYVIGCCGWLALVTWAGSEGNGGAY